MEMTQTRIAIVDDHELFREGLKRIFDLEDEFTVVAEGRTGREAIRIAGEQMSTWYNSRPVSSSFVARKSVFPTKAITCPRLT